MNKKVKKELDDFEDDINRVLGATRFLSTRIDILTANTHDALEIIKGMVKGLHMDVVTLAGLLETGIPQRDLHGQYIEELQTKVGDLNRDLNSLRELLLHF